jgi:hypothetical protein
MNSLPRSKLLANGPVRLEPSQSHMATYNAKLAIHPSNEPSCNCPVKRLFDHVIRKRHGVYRGSPESRWVGVRRESHNAHREDWSRARRYLFGPDADASRFVSLAAAPPARSRRSTVRLRCFGHTLAPPNHQTLLNNERRGRRVLSFSRFVANVDVYHATEAYGVITARNRTRPLSMRS